MYISIIAYSDLKSIEHKQYILPSFGIVVYCDHETLNLNFCSHLATVQSATKFSFQHNFFLKIAPVQVERDKSFSVLLISIWVEQQAPLGRAETIRMMLKYIVLFKKTRKKGPKAYASSFLSSKIDLNFTLAVPHRQWPWCFSQPACDPPDDKIVLAGKYARKAFVKMAEDPSEKKISERLLKMLQTASNSNDFLCQIPYM